MMMKVLPPMFLLVFVTGCQSVPNREPVIVPPTVKQAVSLNLSLDHRALRSIDTPGTYKVILELTINKRGKVDNIIVKKSSGHRYLDKKATIQAREMIFYAATKDGKFVKSTAILPIVYEIPEDYMYH